MTRVRLASLAELNYFKCVRYTPAATKIVLTTVGLSAIAVIALVVNALG